MKYFPITLKLRIVYMKHRSKFFITLLLLGICSFSFGQTTQLSLNDALTYALKNHPDIKNKLLGEAYADAQVLETKSIGIPQVSANVQFINNTQRQVFVFPLNGVPTPIRVGNTYVTTGTLQANWLAIDASYFLGLKAAKGFTDLAKLQTGLSSRDVSINVTKAYYLVLITKENIELLKQNIATLDAALKQTEGYYKNGFAEKLDVDRLNLTLSNLNVQLDALKDQAGITEQLLKFNMGMPIETPIELTENLETLYKANAEDILKTFDAKLRIEYQLLQTQLTLSNLDKKRYEVSKYPNLVLFANYQQNNFADELDFGTWYGNSFWGFKVGIPIFSGFNNKAQLTKSRITIDQINNSILQFESGTALEANQAKTKLDRSMKTIDIQKKNLELANEILRVSSAKLKEGVGSNLEITNAQQEVKTSQTNYLNAIYDLLNAQLELKKAYGKL